MRHIRSSLILVAVVMACHRPRQMAPQVPLEGIDGKYTFTIADRFIRMEGRLIVAYSEVHLLSPPYCRPIEGPKSSDEMRASWFECRGGQRSSESLRLRFSQIDPINRSRWYARMRVADTVRRCTLYNASGDCLQLLRATGRKWVDRNGAIHVERGFEAVADTGETTNPAGSKRLRVRCDTSAAGSQCTLAGTEGRRRSSTRHVEWPAGVRANEHRDVREH
jgi:hypothetical protein